MIRSSLPATTHTLEMAQVAELNERLSERPEEGTAPVTAAALGMGGARLHPADGTGLPDAAVLVRLSWQGSPEFPDIYGHFGPGRGSFSALLHTAALKQLCRLLGARQRWGVEPPRADPPDR